jgi:hypothetical protein
MGCYRLRTALGDPGAGLCLPHITWGLSPVSGQEGHASRQTELQREFPLHVVCSWLGNSPRIAQQSYLLVTEDDFAKAAGVAKVVA